MYKKFIFTVIFISIALYLLVISINYKIDIFGISHKKNIYLNDISYERYQNAGLIKHYNADTIVTGTSLSENFKVSLFDKLFIAKAIKVPMSGSSAREQSLVIKKAINNGINKVVCDIHYEAYSGTFFRLHQFHNFPIYLYDDNWMNDFKIYLSIEYKLLFKYLFFKDKYFTNNFDKLYNWYEKDKYKFGKFHVLDYLKKSKLYIKDKGFRYRKRYNFKHLKNNFDINIFPLIKNNPQVKFIFFFPPYTKYYFINFYKNNLLDDIISFKKYFIDKCINLPNIKIYDFSIDYKTIENLNNYKDTHHFSQMISDKIFIDMRKNRFLIDSNWKVDNIINYKQYLEKELKDLNDTF